MRKTKIVCTMGPNESDDSILQELAKEMDVARFNFSHGTHESHLELLRRVRSAAEAEGRPIAMLLDTKGPEIRTGTLAGHLPVKLEKESQVLISHLSGNENQEGTEKHIFVTYDKLADDISEGGMILIDDGTIELQVDEIRGKEVLCTVITGGELGEKKGVNLPGVSVSLPDLTEKDYDDIAFGLEHGFDYIAASFVRNADTIRKIRELIEKADAKTRIIAKIESREGIDNLKEIIDAADGVMVARGDLGVEVEAKMVPQLQRKIIAMCNAGGKIVITATQMLDSMIRNPRPTRAEVTDVANAVYEGSDAVMLSGETANGKYPVEALHMMAQIAEYTEQFARTEIIYPSAHSAVFNSICKAAVAASKELEAKAIVAPTTTGKTALAVSKCRPGSDVYAFSPDPVTVRQMMLFWGVRPILTGRAHSTDELMEDCLDIIRENNLAETGDILVFLAGIISGRRNEQRSETNMMHIIQF